jgi:putative ABC transport system substrate-binding protein
MLDNLGKLTETMSVTIRRVEIGALTSNGFNHDFDTQKPDAVLVIPDAATLNLSERIASLAQKNRIPIISTNDELTRAGGLISYGPSRIQIYRRSAYFVKKVLDGVKPADLPVEQPIRVVLAVNLKTASALNLSIPDALLAIADEVVE